MAAIVSVQPQYNLLCRSTEWDLIPIAREEGLAVLPWSPLKVRASGPQVLACSSYEARQGGWLAGKRDLTRERPSSGSRVEWAEHVGWRQTGFSDLNTDHTWSVLDAVAEVARKTEKTAAQVSLRHAALHSDVPCDR